jgi:hypothetical protein
MIEWGRNACSWTVTDAVIWMRWKNEIIRSHKIIITLFGFIFNFCWFVSKMLSQRLSFVKRILPHGVLYIWPLETSLSLPKFYTRQYIISKTLSLNDFLMIPWQIILTCSRDNHSNNRGSTSIIAFAAPHTPGYVRHGSLVKWWSASQTQSAGIDRKSTRRVSLVLLVSRDLCIAQQNGVVTRTMALRLYIALNRNDWKYAVTKTANLVVWAFKKRGLTRLTIKNHLYRLTLEVI